MNSFIQHLNPLSRNHRTSIDSSGSSTDGSGDFSSKNDHSSNGGGGSRRRRSSGASTTTTATTKGRFLNLATFEDTFDILDPMEKIRLLEKYADMDKGIAMDYFKIMMTSPPPDLNDDELDDTNHGGCHAGPLATIQEGVPTCVSTKPKRATTPKAA